MRGFSSYVSDDSYSLKTLCRATALYSYEYIITLEQEINHIWAKKWSLTTLIFVVNRYMAFLVAILNAPWTVNDTVSIILSIPFRSYRARVSDIGCYRRMIILQAGTRSVLLYVLIDLVADGS
jgi:hypothetical protein